MGVVVNDVGCYHDIVTSQRTSDVLLFPLSTGLLSELEMVTYFFCENFRAIRIAQFSY